MGNFLLSISWVLLKFENSWRKRKTWLQHGCDKTTPVLKWSFIFLKIKRSHESHWRNFEVSLGRVKRQDTAVTTRRQIRDWRLAGEEKLDKHPPTKDPTSGPKKTFRKSIITLILILMWILHFTNQIFAILMNKRIQTFGRVELGPTIIWKITIFSTHFWFNQ